MGTATWLLCWKQQGAEDCGTGSISMDSTLLFPTIVMQQHSLKMSRSFLLSSRPRLCACKKFPDINLTLPECHSLDSTKHSCKSETYQSPIACDLWIKTWMTDMLKMCLNNLSCVFLFSVRIKLEKKLIYGIIIYLSKGKAIKPDFPHFFMS